MVNYQSEDEIHDSVYQVLWSHTMDKGKYKNSSNYKKVEALLLCWKEECNDLANTDKEVNRLKSVLEGRFKYNVSIECLDSNVAGRLQVQLNALVATFVMTHDGPNTLLIVYYGGHGRPGPLNGHLQLLGSVHGYRCVYQSLMNGRKTSPNDPSKRLDTIIWNQTEELLKPAEADVLELFDW